MKGFIWISINYNLFEKMQYFIITVWFEAYVLDRTQTQQINETLKNYSKGSIFSHLKKF